MVCLMVATVRSQGQQTASKTQQARNRQRLLMQLAATRGRGGRGGMGSLFPLLALGGGSSDAMMNYFLLSSMMNPQSGGGMSGMGGMLPLLMLEGGLF